MATVVVGAKNSSLQQRSLLEASGKTATGKSRPAKFGGPLAVNQIAGHS